MIKKAFLSRFFSSDSGTCGILTAGDFSCRVIELPWRDNRPSISCIPAGTYRVVITESPHYGRIYHVGNVPGRSSVLIHWGNWAGDTEKGFRTNSQGCILPGKYFAHISGQQAVALSRPTVRLFMETMNYEPFELIIENVYKEAA